MATTSLPDLDRLRPAGTKRSSKRDLIVNVFLRQEGHLTADESSTCRSATTRGSAEPPSTAPCSGWSRPASRARSTSARAASGSSILPPSPALPPDLQECSQSFEFLSSDIEAIVEEVAAARGFTARQSVVQIYGECEDCRTGRARRAEGRRTTEMVFARDALRIAIATERSGLEFYTRAAAITQRPARPAVFQKLAEEEKEHLGTLEARYKELLEAGSRSSSRGRRSCSSRAPPTACSPRAPSELTRTASTICRR